MLPCSSVFFDCHLRIGVRSVDVLNEGVGERVIQDDFEGLSDGGEVAESLVEGSHFFTVSFLGRVARDERVKGETVLDVLQQAFDGGELATQSTWRQAQTDGRDVEASSFGFEDVAVQVFGGGQPQGDAATKRRNAASSTHFVGAIAAVAAGEGHENDFAEVGDVGDQHLDLACPPTVRAD